MANTPLGYNMSVSGAAHNADLVAYLMCWVLAMAQKPKFSIVHMYNA
ncbi:hypothetical protein [Nostoc sp.]